jgi:hypothetical protein
LRIAALASGILAGLLASLILALGGLDPALLHGADPRYVALGLSLIASLAIFAAAFVLANALAGAVLMVLAGAAWVGAAIALRHGPDLQLIAPPALLLVGAVLAGAAFLRRNRHLAVPRLELPSAEAVDDAPLDAPGLFAAEPEPYAEPIPELAPLPGYEAPPDLRPGPDEDWRPGKRRPPPPRQEPVFREPDEDVEFEEESPLRRFARGLSGVLSFGLYGALATAAVLVYIDVRSDGSGSAAPVQIAEAEPVIASSSAPPAAAPASVLPPAASLAPSGPALPDSGALSEDPTTRLLAGDVAGSTESPPLRQVGPGTIFAAPEQAASSASFETALATTASSSFEPPSSSGPLAAAMSSASSASEVPMQLQPENLLDPAASASSSAEPPPQPAQQPGVAAPGGVMPFTMAPQMAAERAQPSPGPTAARSPPPPQDTTGL